MIPAPIRGPRSPSYRPPVPNSRRRPASDGRIYVLGGYDASYSVVNVAEAYDPVDNTWTTLAPMPTARIDFTAVTGPDGRIYALGGYDNNYNVLSDGRSLRSGTTCLDHGGRHALAASRIRCRAGQ